MRNRLIRVLAILAFGVVPHAIPAAPASEEQVSDRALLMAAAGTLAGYEVAVDLIGADPLARASDGWTAAEAARMVGEEALAQRIEQAARR